MFLLDQLATHVTSVVSGSAPKVEENGSGNKFRFTVDPTLEAEEAWTIESMSGAAAFASMAGCTPSYFNVEGELDKISRREAQMKMAREPIWPRGMNEFVNLLEDWRPQRALKGLEVGIPRKELIYFT